MSIFKTKCGSGLQSKAKITKKTENERSERGQTSTEGPDKDISPQHTRCLMRAVFSFWLISVVNVSTTDTLFEQAAAAAAASTDVKICSMTAEKQSCDQGGHEKNIKRKTFLSQPLIVSLAMFSNQLTGCVRSTLCHVVCELDAQFSNSAETEI